MIRETIKLKEIDTKIIRLLQVDGRQPNTELARRLGVAEGTVRKRIARLRRENVVQIGAWMDPLKIGYQIYAHIEIRVRLSSIERVAQAVARLPEVFFVGICTGAFDIFAAGLFLSNQHMDEFITKRLSRVPGIDGTSTSSVIRVVKRDYRLQIPSTNGVSGNRQVRRKRSVRP
jgi:Lrp/AsnC family transcriptional regulator for asnA, asnC and gidA